MLEEPDIISETDSDNDIIDLNLNNNSDALYKCGECRIYKNFKSYRQHISRYHNKIAPLGSTHDYNG